MAQFNWTVKGALQLGPRLDAVEISNGTPVRRAGVLVEAREIAADETWDNWGPDATCPAVRLAPIARAGGRS